MPKAAGAVIYPLSLVFIGVMAYGFYRRFLRYGIRPQAALEELVADAKETGMARLRNVVSLGLLHKKITRRPFAGAFHWFIYGGMLLLTLGTMTVALQQDLLSHIGVTVLKNGTYFFFEFALDTAALFFVAGCLMALGRRLLAKPDYLENTRDAVPVLLLLLFLGVSGLLLEGMRLAAHPVAWGGYSYIGSVLAAFLPAAAVPSVYPVLWWGHLFAALTMLAIVPFTKLFHIVAIPVHLFLETIGVPKAKLSMPFNLMEMAEDDDAEPQMGIATVKDLDWKRCLALDACINCGRCERVCPAHAAGRELSPRLLVQGLKKTLQAPPVSLGMKRAEANDLVLDEDSVEEGEGADVFTDGVITENAAWSCLNCGACMEECPASIHHVEYTLDLRRHLFSKGEIMDKQAALLSAVERNGNPYAHRGQSGC